MTVRVRFAPSPTGYLHIGGARTCLYNYLFAKAMKGKLILRIEDTDLERSSREFETSQIADLMWLGIEFDEGPHVGGKHGPYRQSERLELYKKNALKLIQDGNAFWCFCQETELEEMREKAMSQGQDPHYDGRCRRLSAEAVKQRLEQGHQASVRFHAPTKAYTFVDRVREEVTFPANMVGDFVILRSNGMPTYNYCCVVDDIDMKITHVIRAEEHLNNTVRQLMIYEAFGATPPEFAHVSLLVGHDRQKLSKRHGATSVDQYRQLHYLPQAINNYLCLLGWAHPEEKDIFSLDEAAQHFSIDRFNKAPALYDIERLNWFNGQYLKNLAPEKVLELTNAYFAQDSRWSRHTDQWKNNFIVMCKEKINKIDEMLPFLEMIHSEELGEMKWGELNIDPVPTKEYLQTEISKENREYIDAATVDRWMNELKAKGVKGKSLFMGVRGVLTGSDHGPDLKLLLPLIKVATLKKRLN